MLVSAAAARQRGLGPRPPQGQLRSSISTWTSGRGRGAKAQVWLHTTTTDKLLPLWATSACAWQPQKRTMRPRCLGSSSVRAGDLGSPSNAPKRKAAWGQRLNRAGGQSRQAGTRRRRGTREPEHGGGSDPVPENARLLQDVSSLRQLQARSANFWGTDCVAVPR